MIYNNITNEEVINLYEDYQMIKQLISELEELKNYLIDNRIIKQSNTYIVMNDFKFNYNSYKKYRNILIYNYIAQNQFSFLNRIYSLTYKFIFSIEDNFLVNNTNLYYSEEELNEIVKDIFGLFKFGTLYEIKRKIKALILNKINKTEIRTI